MSTSNIIVWILYICIYIYNILSCLWHSRWKHFVTCKSYSKVIIASHSSGPFHYRYSLSPTFIAPEAGSVEKVRSQGNITCERFLVHHWPFPSFTFGPALCWTRRKKTIKSILVLGSFWEVGLHTLYFPIQVLALEGKRWERAGSILEIKYLPWHWLIHLILWAKTRNSKGSLTCTPLGWVSGYNTVVIWW